MSGRSGRERVHRDYPSRYEDKGSGDSSRGHNRSSNPPSRHLWVGNLSHNIVDEGELAHHFSKFGPLESIAFQPGRSYAFVNFEREEDAILAIRELQGFPLAGNPLRIEFAKAVVIIESNDHQGLPDKSENIVRRMNTQQQSFIRQKLS